VLRDLRDLRVLKGEMLTSASSQPSSSTSVSLAHARKVTFNRTLDIRGMRVDEATEALIAYMDDALMVGAGEVTILHGTGTGALKQLTRDYLNDINRRRHKRGQVALEFGDGDVNHGGAGLTVVQL
jgi:DNA mismatch repair protein MutS2